MNGCIENASDVRLTKKENVATDVICQELCQEDPVCNSFLYKKESKICLTSMKSLDEMESECTSISGPMEPEIASCSFKNPCNVSYLEKEESVIVLIYDNLH